MKATIPLLILFVAVSVCRGDEPVSSFSSLPPSVYFVSEPIESGPPGRSSSYEVHRGDKTIVVIFSTAAAAERFLADLPDAKAHKRSGSALPKSFVRDLEKRGARFILDPKTPLEGGSLVAADPKNPEEDRDNPELKMLCDEDQADRSVADGKSIDWSMVAPRDAKRLARVKALYLDGKVSSAADYFNAALVLQHGAVPEDFLLAHEFAIVSVRKGYPGNAAWLVAASEDRFLQIIGRKQRFGTQLTDPIVVDECITDRLRAEFGVPSLTEEVEQAKAFQPKSQPNQTPEPTAPSGRGSP